MLSLGCEDYPPALKKKKKKKNRFWIITCTTIWVCYHYYGVFFAHLLILQYPDHHQNLISSSLYYSGPLHKISSQSVHNFLSNVVHRQTNKQTDKQTDKLTNATKNITSFAKEVINHFSEKECYRSIVYILYYSLICQLQDLQYTAISRDCKTYLSHFRPFLWVQSVDCFCLFQKCGLDRRPFVIVYVILIWICCQSVKSDKILTAYCRNLAWVAHFNFALLSNNIFVEGTLIFPLQVISSISIDKSYSPQSSDLLMSKCPNVPKAMAAFQRH